jgi:hypothetical protein
MFMCLTAINIRPHVFLGLEKEGVTKAFVFATMISDFLGSEIATHSDVMNLMLLRDG